VRELLQLSKLEAGKIEVKAEPFDVAAAIESALNPLKLPFREKGVELSVVSQEALPPLTGDEQQFTWVVSNLVNNALKYSDTEKFLGVKLYRADGVLKLEVVDRGIGIARNEQSKIFEKFYRAGNPLVHNTKGSGLGLSLVRHIAHAHGGEVEVESTPGKGSTFTLTLPLDRAIQQPASDAVRMAG